MALSELEGTTLGEKHRAYNKLFKEALETTPTDTNEDGGNDITNLIKIDIACHNRDVEYILNVFKSQDILCVIRAVEKSTWLITDSTYSHIINVSYLQNDLFPEMTSKAKTKLMKHIKLHLKDESRVEEFYNNEANLKLAIKWLPNCSVSFIESNVHKHIDHIEPDMLKRLCKKSFKIFEKIVQGDNRYHIRKLFDSTSFLLCSHPQEYWEVFQRYFENTKGRFNAKKTEVLMKTIPNQIKKNFLKYHQYIDIPTFVQFIKSENVKGFLLEQVNKSEFSKRDRCGYFNIRCFINYDTVKAFVNRIPKNEQFNFVNEVFIDKYLADISESSVEPTSEIFAKIKLRKLVIQDSYIWYEFAPFDVAFRELKVLMSQSNLEEKYSLLYILTKCLRNNLENVRILLTYFNDKHANDPIEKKYDFIKGLMLNTDVLKYDDETWSILDLLFRNMDIYIPIKNDDIMTLNVCIESIIIYKIFKGESVPETVKEKFVFTTFKSHITKLGNEEKAKLFNFLFNHLFIKIENKDITKRTDFDTVVVWLNDILNLLKDWKKELSDYSSIYNKIKEVVKINETCSWNANLSSLYNKNKSWKKIFFEESVILNPGEDVCLNALKHDPQLLTRYSTKVEKLRCNKSLRRMNRKLRIYWPQTLATEWKQGYLTNLNTVVDSHKTLIRNLCAISSLETITDIFNKYIPKDAKINWSETNEMELSMQRNISLNMHLSRPQPHPDMVLGYAKGDYLKYALPSVIAIFYNLNLPQSREHIPKLLNAPVSLQKHGIRFAFMKLNTEELKEICSNVWKNSKNATIRKVLFEFTYKLLCKDKDATDPRPVWELLQSFIDNLTYEEDKNIYKLLPDIEKIPISIKGEYFVKSYKFLQRLLENKQKEKETYQSYINSMTNSVTGIIESLPQEFVIELIQQLLNENFYETMSQYSLLSANFGVIPILTAYILTSKSAEDQCDRYEKLVLPLVKQSCALWEVPDKKFIHTHVEELLRSFSNDLQNIVFSKKTVVPYKIFVDIQSELTKALSLPRNYLLLTKWNLVVAFTKIFNEEFGQCHSCNDWEEFCLTIAPLYGPVCLEYLKKEVAIHFPRIYVLFIKALQGSLHSFIGYGYKADKKIYMSLLTDQNFIPGYLAGINLLKESNYRNKSESEVRELILAHPSVEVIMHFHCVWNSDPLTGEV
ncbi:hypothetical protein K1T71_011252 [Dendrolimus kikuchii]|uniref:Uncharacterized protein n=1 Tax=Dendrolimus kikuchii TaxID=765133 RepID=A0ACC1CNP9_9NEOP|nr:hypothetical protein K1T71_011252 [Dendrolimus kikuchii]